MQQQCTERRFCFQQQRSARRVVTAERRTAGAWATLGEEQASLLQDVASRAEQASADLAIKIDNFSRRYADVQLLRGHGHAAPGKPIFQKLFEELETAVVEWEAAFSAEQALLAEVDAATQTVWDELAKQQDLATEIADCQAEELNTLELEHTLRVDKEAAAEQRLQGLEMKKQEEQRNMQAAFTNRAAAQRLVGQVAAEAKKARNALRRLKQLSHTPQHNDISALDDGLRACDRIVRRAKERRAHVQKRLTEIVLARADLDQCARDRLPLLKKEVAKVTRLVPSGALVSTASGIVTSTASDEASSTTTSNSNDAWLARFQKRTDGISAALDSLRTNALQEVAYVDKVRGRLHDESDRTLRVLCREAMDVSAIVQKARHAVEQLRLAQEHAKHFGKSMNNLNTAVEAVQRIASEASTAAVGCEERLRQARTTVSGLQDAQGGASGSGQQRHRTPQPRSEAQLLAHANTIDELLCTLDSDRDVLQNLVVKVEAASDRVNTVLSVCEDQQLTTTQEIAKITASQSLSSLDASKALHALRSGLQRFGTLDSEAQQAFVAVEAVSQRIQDVLQRSSTADGPLLSETGRQFRNLARQSAAINEAKSRTLQRATQDLNELRKQVCDAGLTLHWAADWASRQRQVQGATQADDGDELDVEERVQQLQAVAAKAAQLEGDAARMVEKLNAVAAAAAATKYATDASLAGSDASDSTSSVDKKLRCLVQDMQGALDAATAKTRLAQSVSQSLHEVCMSMKQAAVDLESRTRTCEFCEEAMLEDEGVTCAGVSGQEETRHFTCNDCFGLHVTHEAEKDITDLVERQGEFFCPMRQHGCGCTTPFSPQVVTEHCTEEQFRAFISAMARVGEQRLQQQ